MEMEDAKRLYMAGAGPGKYVFNEKEWEDIRKEMEEIVAAPSNHEAATVILWWDCWDFSSPKHTPMAFARRVRKEASRGTSHRSE